ncbi:hypothetical protein MuYL_3956 [Mucilaginibacter xinganensis]|uniref:Uncharacterized protein n=1 Tax=Mucilaginibacter xinganensis TaxID=1234841 RepID=A0A223P1Y5_9SPHI|nr:hypothetical protein MuYL_3956 [Mucilaginibacter xinganensis]
MMPGCLTLPSPKERVLKSCDLNRHAYLNYFDDARMPHPALSKGEGFKKVAILIGTHT